MVFWPKLNILQYVCFGVVYYLLIMNCNGSLVFSSCKNWWSSPHPLQRSRSSWAKRNAGLPAGARNLRDHDVVGCGRLDGQILPAEDVFWNSVKIGGSERKHDSKRHCSLPPRHLPTNTYGYQHLVACRPEEGRYLISFQMTAVRKKWAEERSRSWDGFTIPFKFVCSTNHRENGPIGKVDRSS